MERALTVVGLPLVLHVFPLDLRRGAQRLGRALRDALDGDGARHKTVTLYPAEAAVLEADFRLDVPRRLSQRLGIDPRVVLRLSGLFRRVEPSLVVAHGSEPLKYIALAAPRRVPVVYHRIGVSHGKPGRAHRTLHQLLFRRSALIVGVSEECLTELRRDYGVHDSHLRLITNGRDPDRFRPRAPDEAPRVPRICFVGHLSRTKRPDLFIRVISKLREHGYDLEGVLIGDGPMDRDLAGPARRAGVELVVRCTDVPERLRDSDIFLFTSLPEGEGMPGVLIEAAMSGLPIVSTDTPGSHTVVRHGQTGFVVGVDDEDGLFEATRRLVADRDLRARMGAEAARMARERFDIQTSAARWREVVTAVSSRQSLPVWPDFDTSRPA